MASVESKSIIDRAKRLYADQLQSELESRHRDQFVAIEPQSGDYFVADTFDAAVKAARAKHPTRLPHAIRIGHPAAFHLGRLEL
jgi:hypothetical protein